MSNKSLKERFWAKVQKSSDPGACWLWSGTTTSTGYGLMWVKDREGRWRNLGAHRVALALSGKNVVGRFVLHRCDNPSCVRPDHLRRGSHKDNMADMTSKGRQARGSGHGRAKLTEDNVMDIRIRYSAGMITQRELADEFGVRREQISDIVNLKSWKHLEQAS
uniref:HNH nuclease domain-containing protein n=1 Tax=Rhodopseudomonas palustris (strain DX-1) TaxID=652103 RepID=E6VL69_RHOPX